LEFWNYCNFFISPYIVRLTFYVKFVSSTMVPVAILISIAVIVLLTTKYNVHPFFALLFACFVMGIGLQLPAAEIIAISKDGFGNILKSLGFILVLGTTLGVVLEHTGATQVMASFLLRRVGDTNAPFAMSLTGFVVGLPIFCDSGYIVLSGLNNALSRRTGASIAVMATALATGLYSVHCLIPPHPGATAAAATIGVDYGKLILAGIVVAIPAMLVGYAWARHAGKNENTTAYTDNVEETSLRQSFSPLKAFLPVAVPILLIAAKSFFAMEPGKTAPWLAHLLVLGDPVLALSVGILLAFAWERCQSGRMGRSRKPLYGQLYRGFESLPLRKVGIEVWNSERLNRYLVEIDQSIKDKNYERAITLSYTCLEGFYKSFVKEKITDGEKVRNEIMAMSRAIQTYLKLTVKEYPDEAITMINHISHTVDKARNGFSEAHFGEETASWLAVYIRDLVNSQIRLLLHFL
jgi:hypothetical protein